MLGCRSGRGVPGQGRCKSNRRADGAQHVESTQSLHRFGLLYVTIPAAVIIKFVHAGIPGEVRVTVDVVRDAPAIGKPAGSEGFPSCLATVAYPGRGYNALFGWVQFVRAGDLAGGQFALDPLRFFEGAPAPHCIYGFCPTLFDAPSRDDRVALDWLAQSFLAPLDLFGERRQVQPLLGFSWGFELDDQGGLTLKPIARLTGVEWADHLPHLQDNFPEWQFHPLTPC
jgi:hypothetical protein